MRGRRLVALPTLLLAALLATASCTTSPGSEPTPAPAVGPSASQPGVPLPSTSPPHREVRYLPLGDSITQGYGVPGAYRTVLWQQLVQRDHDRIDFVGSQSGGPPSLGDQDHEGHSGWCIVGSCSGGGKDVVLPKIDGWMRRYRPDIVSIHLGTNDILHGATGFTTADRLDRLVARVYAANPDAYVVLVQIIPMAGRPEQVAYDALVPKVAAKYQAQGRAVAVVDMSTLLRVPTDYRDQLHPTQAGFDTMGRALYPAISTAYRSFT
jgi:lysophospholipase L1-like esterase